MPGPDGDGRGDETVELSKQVDGTFEAAGGGGAGRGRGGGGAGVPDAVRDHVKVARVAEPAAVIDARGCYSTKVPLANYFFNFFILPPVKVFLPVLTHLILALIFFDLK